MIAATPETTVGEIVDALGVTLGSIPNGAIVTSAVVLLVAHSDDDGPHFAVRTAENTSWVERAGMLATAAQIEAADTAVAFVTDADDEEDD